MFDSLWWFQKVSLFELWPFFWVNRCFFRTEPASPKDWFLWITNQALGFRHPRKKSLLGWWCFLFFLSVCSFYAWQIVQFNHCAAGQGVGGLSHYIKFFDDMVSPVAPVVVLSCHLLSITFFFVTHLFLQASTGTHRLLQSKKMYRKLCLTSHPVGQALTCMCVHTKNFV